jgi:Icc-related predicted phosphoesterase
VKILFTADLHLLPATQDRTLQRLRAWIVRFRPDAVVVAGDLSSASHADETLKKMRGCFSKGPIAVCLGNHDFWLHQSARKECHMLSTVIDRYWAVPARSFDVVLLDVENLSLEGITIVGGYGHYDLGFAVPDLVYEGIRVTEEDYLRGSPFAGSPIRWRDFQLMPSGLHPRKVALEQVEGVKTRLSDSGTFRVIAVLHTPPFEALLGLPTQNDFPLPPSIYAFFRAYLGNRSMGAALREYQHKLVGVVCGHTHRRAGPINLGGGIVGMNIGSDYGDLQAALFSSDSDGFERLPAL